MARPETSIPHIQQNPTYGRQNHPNEILLRVLFGETRCSFIQSGLMQRPIQDTTGPKPSMAVGSHVYTKYTYAYVRYRTCAAYLAKLDVAGTRSCKTLHT